MDANALMMPVELDVRVFDELDRLLGVVDLVTPEAVVAELEKLAAGASREAVAASVGADLARERCRTLTHDASYADDAIVELADDGECDYVVTNDGPLKRRLLAAGVPVIGIRGRNKLAITRP
ncbi:twitching motility protein PilT [Haladaptatus sp. YSMS36]|uniref:twitching motility protein PilT n=1 Tax=unclassified Haladaptatus TaxID=2622732 RepID=UPI0034E94465